MSEVNFLTLDLRKTCRTCLSQDVTNRNVFVKENGIELAEIIRCMTKIELVENDALPQNLCESCADKLMKIHEFKETCEKVDAKLREYLSTRKVHVYIYEDEHSKSVGNVAEKILVSIKGESEESSENNLQTCMDFKMEYVQGQEDISDTMISGDVDDGNDDIEIIEEQLETLSDDESDNLEDTNDLSVSDIKVEDSSEDMEKCCHICNKNFKTRFDLNRHLNTHKDGQYFSCILCDIKFSSRIELTRHNQRLHRKNHTYQCTQCEKYFSRHYNLVRHVAENHVKSEIGLKQDKAGYINRLNEDGLEQQTEDPLHIEGEYSQENDTGRKRKSYPCPVCNKLYNSSTGLQRHSRAHTGERPYLCNYCGPTGTEDSNLESELSLAPVHVASNECDTNTCADDQCTSTSIGKQPSPVCTQETKTGRAERIRRKHCCLYCNQPVGNFWRHLERNHNDEDAVQEIMKFPIRSKKRKALINKLRREGDFATANIIPVRRLRHEALSNYIVCKYCRGYYSRKGLHRHVKTCTFNPDPSKRISAKIEGQNLMAGHFDSKDILKTSGLLNMIRADDIGLTAKTDLIICEVARRYIKTHRTKNLLIIAKRNMRRLARLLQSARLIENQKCWLIDILKPSKFEVLIKSTEDIAEYEENTMCYRFPLLAVEMGSLIKDAINTAHSLEVKKGTPCKDQLERLIMLKNLIDKDWPFKIAMEDIRPGISDEVLCKQDETDNITQTGTSTNFHKEGSSSKHSRNLNRKVFKIRKGIKRTLVPWTDEQKKLTEKFFEIQIQNKSPPKKHEVMTLINRHPEVFSNKSWPVIKVFVQNKYTKKC